MEKEEEHSRGRTICAEPCRHGGSSAFIVEGRSGRGGKQEMEENKSSDHARSTFQTGE